MNRNLATTRSLPWEVLHRHAPCCVDGCRSSDRNRTPSSSASWLTECFAVASCPLGFQDRCCHPPARREYSSDRGREPGMGKCSRHQEHQRDRPAHDYDLGWLVHVAIGAL